MCSHPTRPLVLAGVCLLVDVVSLASGQTIQIVVPNRCADAEAASWAGAKENLRAQYIYAADQFAELPPGGAYLLRVRWRPDGAVSLPGDFYAEELTWSASVTSQWPDNMSLAFAENFTGPITVVLVTAPWQAHTDSRGPPGGPKVFDIEFVLDPPYHYDPAEGNLLLDGVVRGLVWAVRFDRLAADEKLEAAVIVVVDDVTCPVAQYYVGAQVTEFTFAPRLEGACCLPDGTCAEPIAQATCTDLGGTFRGPSTTCGDGSTCLGACCMGIHGCSETLTSECTGDFEGPGSTCAQGCPCPDPFADIDLDGDVDQHDFAVLQLCLAGPNVWVSGVCLCFDQDPGGAPDGDVDADDLVRFLLCASGPSVPLNPDCDMW